MTPWMNCSGNFHYKLFRSKTNLQKGKEKKTVLVKLLVICFSWNNWLVDIARWEADFFLENGMLLIIYFYKEMSWTTSTWIYISYRLRAES
jgi:hypothetical protein